MLCYWVRLSSLFIESVLNEIILPLFFGYLQPNASPPHVQPQESDVRPREADEGGRTADRQVLLH